MVNIYNQENKSFKYITIMPIKLYNNVKLLLINIIITLYFNKNKVIIYQGFKNAILSLYYQIIPSPFKGIKVQVNK